MRMATGKLCLVLSACLALAPLAPLAMAQAAGYEPPRTADGRPDFHGNWTTQWATRLERPPQAASLELSEEEADLNYAQQMQAARNGPEGAVRDPYADRDITGPLTIGGKARSSLIVDPADGRLPLTQEGRARLANIPGNGNLGEEGPERRGPTERCIGGSAGLAPFLTMPSSNIRQIVQTRDHIAVLTESFSQLRIIPFGAYGAPGRGGTSSARWEGDTLVVHTKGYLEGESFRGSMPRPFALSPQSQITERFTRTAPDEIFYRFTVEDPVLYTQAWTGESMLKRTDERMYEFACHEGNYSMANTLRGARSLELREAKGKR